MSERNGITVPEGMRYIERPRLATMWGSDSDLDQAYEAHECLILAEDEGKVELYDEWTNSIHGNPGDVLAVLPKLIGKVDAIEVGAGWANQLTGCVNAFLRNFFRDSHIVIFGVAISHEEPRKTDAAILSITELPRSEVVYRDYLGSEGALRAAQDMITGLYPIIQLRDLEDKPAIRRSIEDAAAIGWEKRLQRQQKQH